MMAERSKVYGNRWVVQAVFVFINLTLQTLWITFASITRPAANFYQVGDLQIGCQYAAELTYPVPEGTSNGMLTLFG